MFFRIDGALHRRHNSETACDHYHRWRDDVQFMKDVFELEHRIYRAD